ncbi:MAG TPA: hypothetical protein VMS40_01600 [Vicinamibacterales bacterium]|nr:hypothetical protein [Vicinamibacterales bacterium]
MSEQGTRAVAAVARLRLALEHTAGALAQPDLAALLAGESEIEVALAELPATYELSPDERRVVRGEVERAHAALLRCRRLGASLGSFVRISLEAQGLSEYGPRKAATSYAGQALDARM